jgi:hypothetical protein
LVPVERFFLYTSSNTTSPENYRSIGLKMTGTTEPLPRYSNQTSPPAGAEKPRRPDRTHLLERFEPRHQRPLTLIIDPAGYGKSILISRWLKTNNCPSAWLSLVYILDGEMPASCGASSLFVDMIDHPATPVSVAGVYHHTHSKARNRMRQRGMG